jgi:shikimate dehydrogenase
MKRRFAIIGDPVEHSLSPAMHNAAFKHLKLDCSYESVRITREQLKPRFSWIKNTFNGINVTIPHKVQMIGFMDKFDKTAELVGAVNCVKFDVESIGYNTDLKGAVNSLQDAAGPLKGRSVMVIGAGGAARAVVFGCLLEGADVSVYNRTRERAEGLARDVEGKLKKKIDVLDSADLEDFDVLVNATSVGMHPDVDETLITADMMHADLTVMDVVYNPLKTKLLQEAEKAGAKTIGGLEMLVQQGAESLRIWGIKPPVGVMRKAVLKELR